MEYTSINTMEQSRKSPRVGIQTYIKVLPILNLVISFMILGLLIFISFDLKTKGNEMGTTVNSMSDDINSEISKINSIYLQKPV